MSATCIMGQYEVADTVVIQETFSDFPSTAYSVTLYLNLNGTAATNAAGTGSGTTWTFTLSNTVTTALTAGLYDYVFRATKTADNTTTTAKTGQLTFIPNLAVTTAKSAAEILLDSLNATILTLSASGNSSVSFNGQSFAKRDLHQLMEMRRELEAQVFREKRLAANLRGVVNDGSITPYFPLGASVGPFSPFAPWNR